MFNLLQIKRLEVLLIIRQRLLRNLLFKLVVKTTRMIRIWLNHDMLLQCRDLKYLNSIRNILHIHMFIIPLTVKLFNDGIEKLLSERINHVSFQGLESFCVERFLIILQIITIEVYEDSPVPTEINFVFLPVF